MAMFYSKLTGGFYSDAYHDSMPPDALEVSDTDYEALLVGQAAGKRIAADANGRPVLVDPPSLTQDQQKAACVAAIQEEMERQAQAKGYDSLLSACSYAALPAGAPFQAEGAAFLAWRAQVWQAALAQTGPVPTPEEAVAAMPALVLPS